MRELTEQELKLMMSFGALHYTPELIADNLDEVTSEEIRRALKDKASPIYKAYHKGKSRGQFKIDVKLLELAQGGDIDAIKLLERRQREIQMDQPPEEGD